MIHQVVLIHAAICVILDVRKKGNELGQFDAVIMRGFMLEESSSTLSSLDRTR
jgi:hypothetical protein